MGFIGQSSVIGSFQDKIKNSLLVHAYALTGARGLGKKTLGAYLAKMILCTSEDMKPCDRCRSCKSCDAGSNPQFMAISSETQKILIKQIRALIEDISIRPAQGRKVYLIEEADRMTPDAQNCLLKTLEEPPEYAVILLATSAYESLLATVRSRVVQVRLKPYSMEELRRIAQSKGIEVEGKEHILSWSRGNPGKALQLLGDKSFEENRRRVFQFAFQRDGLSHLELNEYLSKNKEAFPECMEILESVYRDALLLKCGVFDGLINSDKQDNILEYARQHSQNELTEKLEQIHEIRSNLRRYMNYQLAVDMVTLANER